jgi:hypothetical protein
MSTSNHRRVQVNKPEAPGISATCVSGSGRFDLGHERYSAQAAKCGQFDHAFRYPELQSVKPTAAPNAVSQLPEDDATDCRKESVSVLAVLLTSATCAYSGRTSEVRRGAKCRCLHRLVLHSYA